jgi:uroporphyrin-III C-methyltransferase/precorrin-2 dehydrogenase/sirohydrochlorin ferrochelatase
MLDPLNAASADAVQDWLTTQADAGADRLVMVSLLSADPDELTLRTARLLGEADRVYHHPSVPENILNRARADAVRIPADTPPAKPGDGLSLWLEMKR